MQRLIINQPSGPVVSPTGPFSGLKLTNTSVLPTTGLATTTLKLAPQQAHPQQPQLQSVTLPVQEVQPGNGVARPPQMLLRPSALGPSVEDYKQMDQRTHVYVKQASYVGSDHRMEREVWLYDVTTNKMTVAVIDYVEACERIYLEILTNASDNVGRSQRAGVDPGKIEIIMNNSKISVKNYGLPMPVEVHPCGKYVPDMVLGTLLTSSNYEGERHEAGTNGIGAKATNIFSEEFTVIVEDAIRHLRYTKTWYDNMTRDNGHIITGYDGKISSVQVIYLMDFERFKYPVPVDATTGGYTPEAFALFNRHAIDISFTAKTPVIFNGVEFNFPNIRDYGRLYFGDVVDTAVVHYQWPEGTEVIQKKKGYQIAAAPGVRPLVELIALDTPDEGRHISFVNCMMTHDGGVHVTAAIKAVGDPAVQHINESVLTKLTRMNKGKAIDAKEKRASTITIADVRPHISMLVSVRVSDPEFTSQTKRTLSSPTPKIAITEEELKPIDHWQLLNRLYAALEAKQFASLAKTDGKLKRYVRLQKGVDANQAGKTERHKCVLYITEGKSGAGYANTVVANIPNGRDYIGVLPMRGKGLNVMNADWKQIEKNVEIAELKKMLGLAEGVNYTDPKNFARLRYGSILIMADSDVDGKHIIGLIINIFHCRFPSLLACGFVMFYRSPTIRVTKNKTTLKFFTKYEYDCWRQATPDFKTWAHQYFKGMGTSEIDDVKDDMKQPRVVKCFYDIEAPTAMKLAFDIKLANLRKEWISSWQRVIGVEDIVEQPISLFINQELILFSLANIQRCIPRMTDGLKDCHRKIVHAAHKKWKVGSKKGYEKYKVAQFEGFIASTTHYEHAEANLCKVVIGLAQEFTCSNNIPILAPRGQFGMRYYAGDDAAASRYIYTHPHPLMHNIFRKEDRPILKHKTEEGTEVEPETYWPVIPCVLYNGTNAIASAWSSTILNHDPLDLTQWIRLYLQGVRGDSLPNLVPYYRGYTGVIKLIDRRKKNKNGMVTVTVVSNDANGNRQTQTLEENEVEYQPTQDECLGVKNLYTDADAGEEIIEGQDIEGDPQAQPDYDERPLLSMVSFGNFTHDLTGKIIITELPIGRVPLKYRKWLEQLQEDKKITDVRDLCTDNTVRFEITGFQDANYRSLKLRRTIGMSNMVLLDEQDKPVRYDTAYDICEAFTLRRLPVYQDRKNYILQNLAKEVQTLHYKIRFIRAVIDKELIIVNTKIAVIREGLTQLGIPHEIYENSKIRNLSEDDILKLQQDITNKEQEYQVMAATSSEQLWLSDLDDLDRSYRAYYKITTTVAAVPQNILTYVPTEALAKKPEPRAKIIAETAAAKRRAKADTKFSNPDNSMLLSVASAQTATAMPNIQLPVARNLAAPIKLTMTIGGPLKPGPLNSTVTGPVKLTLAVKPQQLQLQPVAQ